MRAYLLLALLLPCASALAQLPDAQAWRGEIRRDADGKLVAVPPPAHVETQSVQPPPKAAAPGAMHKPQAASVKPALPPESGSALPRTLRVGLEQQIRSIAVAAAMAKDGDTIEIEAGDYFADVAVFKQAKLTLRGVGLTRPRLIASGASAEGKAIWVIRGGQITVENIEFRDARVPDRNGAGIRFEAGHLTVRNCKFENNENGILSAGGADMRLDIENSEFGHNGAGDGRSHNIYIGEIQRLRVSGSYFHHARVGHLLKSRAAENHVLYNRLTDETGGRASYELEFPNGGIAYVMGNIIEQGSQTENANIISYAAEGLLNRPNALYLVNNTIIDNRPNNGNLLMIVHRIPRIVVMNNLLLSQRKFEIAHEAQLVNNLNVDWDPFAMAARYDFRLKPNASMVGKYAQPPTLNDVTLVPQREYIHPAGSRSISGATRRPGAMQSLAQ